MNSWGVVKTQPRCERVVSERINELGYETYVPQYRALVCHARKKTIVLRPLFSTYVFFHLDLDRDQWQCVGSLPGTICVVRFGLRPSTISDAALQAIREASSDGVFDDQLPRELQKGDRVRIKNGPFEEIIASIASFEGKNRHIAVLNLISEGVKIGNANFLTTIDNLERAV